MRGYFFLMLVVAIPIVSSGASPELTTLDEAVQRHLLLTSVWPVYPREARESHTEGDGIFELKFDYESGHLREVHVVKSTGNHYLDGHAIGALKLWRAKPRSIHSLLVPIRFSMARHE
jgi:TonB family protein